MVVPKWRKLFDAHKQLPPQTLFRMGIPVEHDFYDDLLQDAAYALVKACQWYTANVSKQYTGKQAKFKTIAIMFIRRHVTRQHEHYKRRGLRARTIPKKLTVDMWAGYDYQEEISEGVQQVIAAMECLTLEEQHYICAYFFCGLSQYDLMKSLDASCSTVQRHLHRGIEKLQNNLATSVDK